MRPFDEVPFEQSDYSDVALMLAAAREWPAEEFVRELDARAARRFAPAPAAGGGHVAATRSRRRSRLLGGLSVGLALAGAAAVVAFAGGGLGGRARRRLPTPERYLGAAAAAPAPATTHALPAGPATPSNHSSVNGTAALNAFTATPTVPGAKQIRSAQIDLTTPNQHVNQVASEVIGVVSFEHGTVMSSQITAASSASGGGYATFTLRVPTANLQTTVDQLSRLRYADLASSTAGSQNVSDQYASDQRQLGDAQALRGSLLKALATAATQQQIDSIDAQLKLASGQVTRWQRALASLNHRISFSTVTVQVNAGGLPILPVAHRASGLTLGRAWHDALRVLVVSAGVALIALALAIPLGLAAALLAWLWLWSRRRRREQALDQAS